MINWYVAVRRLLRDIEKKSRDALTQYESGGKEASAAVNEYLKSDYQKLSELWREQFPNGLPSNLGRHIGFGMDGDYRDILNRDLVELEQVAEEKLLETGKAHGPLGFEYLLHPEIEKNCYDQFRNGYLRDAVLNSVIAIFDQIRKLTGIDADGEHLVNKAFSLTEPCLVFSELETESGQNDQKGFIQIFKGAFQGIRNPKAHSLAHDLTEQKTAQYLVFASLLARRLDEARVVKK